MLKTNSNLIIGSNSFLGVSLSKKLDDLGEKVLGVYHKNVSSLYSKINHIQISQLATLKDDFDVVYIISAFVPNAQSKNIEKQLKDANIDLVKNICKQFTNAKIVYCSSVSVYAPTHSEITETSVISPISLYGESKLKGEQLVSNHKNYAIVRISSMYGIGMKQDTFLPIIIKNAIKTNEITIYGKGNRLQNYIHVEDVANYLIAASKTKIKAVFLAVGKKSVANIQAAQLIKQLIPNIKINFEGNDNSKSYLYNNSFTKKTLKIKPEKNFKKEVQNCIEWLKKMY